jgi:hypothetical protein
MSMTLIQTAIRDFIAAINTAHPRRDYHRMPGLQYEESYRAGPPVIYRDPVPDLDPYGPDRWLADILAADHEAYAAYMREDADPAPYRLYVEGLGPRYNDARTLVYRTDTYSLYDYRYDVAQGA